MKELLSKIWRRWMKFRLQPIRVFCFHQVSDVFDASSMWQCDWMSLEEFKNKISILASEYTFISISQASYKLKHDWIRRKKYAVLTADDGSKSIECVLPWLLGQEIPVTLFINGSYLDGKTYRVTPKERYFTKEELLLLNNDLITFGHHGWNHKDLSTLSESDFLESISQNMEIVRDMPHPIAYWAYPYGTHTVASDRILNEHGLIPVYMDGQKNYNNPNCIHRELL